MKIYGVLWDELQKVIALQDPNEFNFSKKELTFYLKKICDAGEIRTALADLREMLQRPLYTPGTVCKKKAGSAAEPGFTAKEDLRNFADDCLVRALNLLLGEARYKTFVEFFEEHLKGDKKGRATHLDVELCRYLLTGELKFQPKYLRFSCGEAETYQRLVPYATLIRTQLAQMDNYAWRALLYGADVNRLLMQVVTFEKGDLIAKHAYCLEQVLDGKGAVWTFANVEGKTADQFGHDCPELH